jgi:hypothetical protein
MEMMLEDDREHHPRPQVQKKEETVLRIIFSGGF